MDSADNGLSVRHERTQRSRAHRAHPYKRPSNAASMSQTEMDDYLEKSATEYVFAPTNKETGIRRRCRSAPKSGRGFTVFVGCEEQVTEFAMHEDLVASHSPVLATALKKEWKEGQERTIHLPDYDSNDFWLFFHFVYNHGIFSNFLKESSTISENLSEEEQRMLGERISSDQKFEWTALASAWQLADYLEAVDFKDVLADAIVEKARHDRHIDGGLRQSLHKRIYPCSTKRSPIRTLLADIAAQKWSISYLEGRTNEPPWSEFFQDVACSLTKLRKGSEPEKYYNLNPCIYDEHRIHGTSCYRSRLP